MKYPNIAAERVRRGLSQDDLAREMRVTRKTIYNWEVLGNIPASSVGKLADFFGVSADYLLGRTAPAATYADDAKDSGRVGIRYARKGRLLRRDGRALQSGGRRRCRRLRKPRLGERELCVRYKREKPGCTASQRGGAVSYADGAFVLRDGVMRCADSVRIR